MKRSDRPAHPAAFILPGFAATVGLHALFVTGWDALFARPPWSGYEDSARLGMIEPWFVHSPRALWLTRAVLFVLAFGIVLSVRKRRTARTVALWTGAAAGVALTWAATMSSTIEGGAAGFVFYPLRVALPIGAGALSAALAQRLFRGGDAT